MTASSTKTAVLVHGAWHGAWCWEKVTPLLDDAGVPWVALDLPLSSLSVDAAAVRSTLDDVGGPVVLLGHSYGGAVITEAGNHPSVDHLVYLCAFALEQGESVSAAARDEALPATDLGAALQIGDDGMCIIDPARDHEIFYQDCSRADSDAAIARLRPMPLTTLTDAATSVAWKSKPTTYVVCADDQAVHPELQRFMAKRSGGAVVEWPTSHSPFISQPALIADLFT